MIKILKEEEKRNTKHTRLRIHALFCVSLIIRVFISNLLFIDKLIKTIFCVKELTKKLLIGWFLFLSED